MSAFMRAFAARCRDGFLDRSELPTRVADAVEELIMPKPNVPRLLGIAEIAERLGVSTKTVRRWIARNELHVYRLGRGLRVSEEDLIAFLSKHRR
jgi:excisionase family DNA binding protein